jgi:poly(hydroxyalkanoate) granule-associated protein
MPKQTENTTKADKQASAQFSDTVKDSAQHIWLAGLGAFSKAQEEGGKVFESLVKEGVAIQRKTQSAAEEKLSEASNRMASMASDISSKATGQWGKLETIFEDRVAKALKKLGAPSVRDFDALVARVEELDRRIAQLNAKTAAGTRSARPRAAKPPSKTAAKPAAKRAPARKAA